MKDGTPKRRLAAPGLTNNTKRFPLVQRKADIVHSVKHTAWSLEILFQVSDLQ